jgi:uncharacterized protein DUF4388
VPWWLVALLVIAAVAVAVLLRLQRPRSIEDELRKASRAPGSRKGVPANASVREVIKALAWERATGKLEVVSGDDHAALYFLFGHLFHAEKGEIRGDAALQAVLGWQGAAWNFDSKSRLPTDETILNEPPYQDL